MRNDVREFRQQEAERVAASVRKIHEKVAGTDSFTGKPYAASDPALLLWVHAALVDSTLAARTLLGTAPTAAEADAYVNEMAVAAELIGVPAGQVPKSVADDG